MIITINPDNIDDRLVEQVVGVLKKGGLIIFPTDTVYSVGCDLYNKKALNELARFKNVKLSKANFSIICSDLSNLSEFVRHIDRPTYKLLNKNLPGPFTFILEATNQVPRLFDTNKKEIGIRIPDNPIVLRIVELLGNPMVSTSLHNDVDDIQHYYIDPTIIYQEYDDKVNLIIDGGLGKLDGSAVIDCTGSEYVILREGTKALET